jgi:hypothetical protein
MGYYLGLFTRREEERFFSSSRKKGWEREADKNRGRGTGRKKAGSKK